MSIPSVINGQFVVGKQIARGAYSTIFQGTNRQTNQTVAIKFELTNIDGAQLDREAKALKLTDGTVGVPRAYYFGREGPYNVLVTDQFGLGMGELFETCNRKLSIKSVCMIARLMIKRIQAVHEKGVLHRYIRPENFLFGKPESEEANVLHVIAFGLEKQYRDPETQRHIPYAEELRFFGSAPFMSINAHLGRQQSRRDDLESIGYVLIYLLLGTLPWMERSSPDTHVQVTYSRVLEKMQKTASISDLCTGFPYQFGSYIDHCRRLGFEEDPDYDFLCDLFTNALQDNGMVDDNVYDWDIIGQDATISDYLRMGLNDQLDGFIASEQSFTDALAAITPLIHSAWSPPNNIPAELDRMLQSMKAICETHQRLMQDLLSVREQLMSHKSIGNRLARWIRDLNQAYSMYCSSFILGFDAWAPIKSNAKLPSILESFSASDPLSPDTAKMLDIGDISTWTLDALILLPKSRLRYIKSIYTPFLKKGQGGIVNHPGVSDGLLKLDALLTILDARERYRVGEPLPASPSTAGTGQILSNRSEGSLSNSLLDMELAPRPVVEPPAEIPTKSRRTVRRGPSYDSLLDMPAVGPLKSNDRTDIGEVERVSAPVVSPVQSSMPDKSPGTLPPKSEVPKEYADGAANSPPSKPAKGQFSVRLWSNLRRKMPRMRINRVDTVSTAKTKQRVAGRQQTQDTTASNETTDDESDGGHAPRANRVRGGGNDYGNHDDESEIALVDICCFCLCFKSRR